MFCPLSFAIPPRSSANSFITFAAPFIRIPNVISATGAMAPRTAVIIVTTFLVPSLKPLNFVNSFPTNSTIGVTACKNAFPTGTNSFFRFSMAFLNLAPVESSTFFNSRSDKIASSSTDAPASPSALAA